FSLIILRSAVRATPSAPAGVAPAVAAAAEETAAQEEQKKSEKKKWRTSETGKSLRDEVAELVADDPETAANILKTWIGNPI
ncbi:MAG TPA: hypothetical protein PL064_03345, partial [Thermogutta sp.]|nr:hypothetical protein [Thermogutta sp.]